MHCRHYSLGGRGHDNTYMYIGTQSVHWGIVVRTYMYMYITSDWGRECRMNTLEESDGELST